MKNLLLSCFCILLTNCLFAGQYVSGDSASDMKVLSKGGVSLQGNGMLLFPARKYSALVLFSKQFPTEKGYVSFIISPLNWDARDGQIRRFIQFQFGNGKFLTIYRFPDKNMDSDGFGILARYVHEPGKAHMISLPNNRIGMSWGKKSWHHIALTWDKEDDKCKMEFYIDGNRVGILQTGFQFEFSPEVKMYIGPDNNELSSSLIGEIILGSTSLDAEKLNEIYEKSMEKTDQ